MTLQVSQHYSLWSFPECPITYFFACPTCRKIWDDILIIHNYIDGPPQLEIPFRCPDCNRQGEAFSESKTGMVEEIRIALLSNELDHNKYLAKKVDDLPGLFRLELKHSYLDMRVIAWEAGGPAPFSENLPKGWQSAEEFENRYDRILEVIDYWWQNEPFMIEILNSRINKRMDNLIDSSIEIPQNDSFLTAYNEFLDNLAVKKERREELTQEIMLKRILPPLPIEVLRGSLAKHRWPWIFESEARILLMEEDKSFKKEKRHEALTVTIAKARGGDLTALRKIIAWDYTWITCPWVSELIRSRPHDFDIQEMLEDGLTGRPGNFKRKQRPSEKTSEQLNLMQYLHDRFSAKLKHIDKFFERVFSDKYEDGAPSYENLKKLRKKHLRK